jgi:hypothetical protein
VVPDLKGPCSKSPVVNPSLAKFGESVAPLRKVNDGSHTKSSNRFPHNNTQPHLSCASMTQRCYFCFAYSLGAKSWIALESETFLSPPNQFLDPLPAMVYVMVLSD